MSHRITLNVYIKTKRTKKKPNSPAKMVSITVANQVRIANRGSRILEYCFIRRQIKVTFSRDVYMKTIAFRFAPRAPCLRPIRGDPGQLHLKTRPCTVASGCGQLSFTSRSRGDSCRQVVPGGSAIAFRFTPREPK